MLETEMEILKDTSILIVEDEESTREMLRTILERKSMKVFTAENGLDGLNKFLEHRPDLIITDIRMPQMGGLEMAREIREELKEDLPIIIASAYNDEEYFMTSIEIGINRYIKKPFNFDQIHKAVYEEAYAVKNHKIINELNIKIYDLLDLLKTMVILTDGKKIKYANKSFLNFISFENFETFYQKYSHIVDLNTIIVKIDDMLIKDETNWIDFIKQDTEKSYISFLHDIKENTSTAFVTTISKLPRSHEDFLISFVNITEIEKDIFQLKNEAKLASVFKLMVEEKVEELREKEQLLLHQSRMATTGEMLSSIIHKWKEPLTTLVLRLQNLQDSYSFDDMSKEYFNETITRCVEQIKEMGQNIYVFRDFLSPSTKKIIFDLNESIALTISLIKEEMKNNLIEISFSNQVDKEAKVLGYPNEFKHILLNLFHNAKDSIIEKMNRDKNRDGSIIVKLMENSGFYAISIIDNGLGIDSSITEKIFEKYSTKKGDKNFGINLYMSRIIIQNEMNGKLFIKNIKDGAEFCILLPKK